MTQIIARGEKVYQCDVCARKVRIPRNNYSLEAIGRCNISLNCPGRLHRVLSRKEINETPANPPAIAGVQDWFQRKVLYTHTQSIESTTWKVKHELGVRPNIQVFLNTASGSLVETEPLAVQIDDSDNITVIFQQAVSGIIQCTASASRNLINSNIHASSTVVPITDMLLSSGGEITIATLSSDSIVSLNAVYKNTVTGFDTIIEYIGVDKTASVDSAWAGVTNAFISGRKYTVRSFNVVSTPVAPTVFESIPVPDGSPVFFDGITSRGEVLLLLSQHPFAFPDRIVDKVIDLYHVDANQPQIYFDRGEWYAEQSVIKSVYPHIIVAS